MDINSRDPSQNIIPFRIKGIEAARFDQSGNLGIGTQTPTDKLQVIGNVNITGSTTMIGTTTIAGNLNLSTNSESSALNNINPSITINGRIIEDKTTTVINMDSQVSTTALNKQKKQSIPLREPSILKTSDVVSKMSGVSVGKSQVYGIGPSQTASYGNIIVAVGGGVGTNSIAYSTANPPTPSSWVGIPLSSSTYTTSGNSIAYANGTWVTVGDGTNSIVYSTVTPPVASSWVKIPINNNVNGVQNTFTTKGHVVTYANGYWVAGGEGTNCMCYSNANPPTAESWIGIPTSARTFTTSVRSISYANGTWVAVGDGTNAIAYSTQTPPVDESWVPIALARTNETGNANIMNSIAISITYANGTWLVGGGTNIPLLYSIENPPISTSWMPITIDANTSQLNQFGSNATCVGYGNGVWVACGNANDIMAYSTATIPHSSSWIPLKGPTTTPSTKTIKSITYNPSTNTWFFCGGWSNNCLFYSTQTPPLPTSWIAVSSGSNTFGTNANALISTTTSAFTSPVNVSRLDNKFTFPANRIIAVGGGNNDNVSQGYSSRYTNNTIVYSDDDGATWLMVPGGANNYMFSSEDGTDDAGIGLGGSKGANAVAWNGERWIAAGNGRTHSLAFSDDGGMTWTGITGKSIFSVEARSIAWNGKMWVAVGRGVNCSTAYSYDGLTWMATVDPSGNRVNIFSYEGPVDNSGNSLSGMSDIYGGGNKVIWNGKFWIATGTRTRDTETNSSYTIAISYDGKTWRKISGENAGSASTANGFDVYAYGVEWNGRYFIATGRGSVNTLAYSTDCISWYGLGKTVFTNWGRGITWGARKWVATGSGRNTIAYSSDGRTWTGCGIKVFNPIRRFMAFGDIATFTNTHNGAPQRGVAISYSDDGITWDAPIINQNLEFRNPRRVLPNAFYLRNGGSNWRDFIPLLTADSTTNIQTWGVNPDNQFHDWNTAPQNAVAQQFSYFAGYWLNANRAMNGDRFTIAYYSPGNNGNFTFTATSNYPVTSYSGSLSSLNGNTTYTLTPQPDGIAAGIAAQYDTFSTIHTTNQTLITNAITDNTNQHTGLMYSTDAGASWSRIPGSSDASSTGGTDMTPANQGCLSLAMNPARTRFLVSGGDSAISTRKVYFSNDGFNWRNGANSPNQSSQMAWVYTSLWIGGSHNRWLIGGNDAANNANGRIMRSSDVDALSAWSTTIPLTHTNSQIICFASNTSFSVILAGSTLFNTIYKSIDGGANWSTITISSSSIGSVLSIAYSPSLLRWVAVGGSNNTAANTIIYSDDDGVNWIAPHLQAKNVATSLFKTGSVVTKVIWDAIGGRFIIGGYNGGNTTFSMAYSSDGINWLPVSIEEPRQSNDASPITTTIGPFFSRCREIMTVDISGEYTQINTGYSVLWNSYANRFIAVGNGTTPIVVSNDGGVTWSTSSQQPQQQAIAVVCGKSGANSRATFSPISYTVDGVTWLQSIGAKGIFLDPGDVRSAKYGETSKSISPNGRLWVAGGTGNSIYSLAFSQNGIRWSGITNSKLLIGDVRTIAYAPSDVSGATTTSNNGIGNGVWVAGGVGGSGTSSIVFSYDGVSWNEVPKSTSILNICNACTYANGMFVAGGEGALYIGNPSTLSGYDGINYLNRIFMLYVTGTTSGSIWGTDIYSSDSVIGKAAVHSGIVAVGETKMVFVQRVNSNVYLESTRNGITTNSYNYYPGFVFLPSTSPICTSLFAYSFDGINWKNIPYTTNQVNGSIKCITYGKDENGKGIWVAGAERRTLPTNPNVSILYSYNGIDWTPVVNSGSLSTSVNSIAYGMNSVTGLRMWIAAVYNSSGYSFIQSSNGRDWSSIPNTKTGLFDNTSFGATSISYLNGVWYATGISTTSGKSVAYSYDGTSWNGVYQYSNMYGISGERLQTYSNTMWAVATVNDITIPAKLSTIRGIAWTSGLGSCYIQHPTIAFGTERVGVSNPRSFRNMTTISPDGGRTWTSTITNSQHLFPEIGGTDIGNTAFNGGVCNDAVWNGMIWVAVGLGSNGSKVATSKDGIQWTQIPVANVPIDGVINTIVWNGKIWMIGGDGGSTNPPSPTANEFSIATSIDAINWRGIHQTDNKVSNVKKIAWNGNYWTAVGSGTVSNIMVSINGVNWENTLSALDTSNGTSSKTLIENVNDVVWGGNKWIAVGTPRINDASNNFTILYSADTPAITTPTVQPAEYAYTGKKWRGVPGSSNLFPFGVKSVCWNGKRFIATGPAYSLTSAGNVIAWSSDGIKWTAYSSRKTFARGQRWVAVGSGNRATIATSADGKNWNEIYESSKLFPDIQSNSLLSPGARAIGWNGTSLTVGGSGGVMDKTSVPVYAFIGSGGNNPILPTPIGASYSTYKISTSVFVSYLDSSRNWLNTYTDLSMTNLFQVTSQQQQFSSAIKWNGYAWVAHFGLTSLDPSGIPYGNIWFTTDPLARAGWSVASNYATPKLLTGQGGYAALEWNGIAWLACGYDVNNNNLIYTTDIFGASGWTAVSGIVSGSSSNFQPVCIGSSSRYWVVGGNHTTGDVQTSAIYFTSDRTGAAGWKMVKNSVLPRIRITSIGYNGAAWLCCGGISSNSAISYKLDSGNDNIETGWVAATGNFPSNMESCSAISYNSTASTWVVVGDASLNYNQMISYTTVVNGSTSWTRSNGLLDINYTKLNGLIWNGYQWIASCGYGAGFIGCSSLANGSSGWNTTVSGTSLNNTLSSPSECTNAVAFARIPFSLLTSGMNTIYGVGTGRGLHERANTGRAQGLLGNDTSSVIARSSNGSEATIWSSTYSKNFMIAVGGGIIRDNKNTGGYNRMSYSYDGGNTWISNNSLALSGYENNTIGSIRTVKYGNGIWVAGGDINTVSRNILAYSRDGVNWVGAGGTQIFGTGGACYGVCCDDRGRWVAVGGAALTTAGTYSNTSGSNYTMAWSDDGMNWTPILGSRALFGIVTQGVSYGADASGARIWTAIGRGVDYTGVAYSYDGKNWILSQSSLSLFGRSVNVLTERYAPVVNASWRSISLSSTGQYQSACVHLGRIYTSSDYGVTWTQRESGRSWSSISVSSTGQYQGAVVGITNLGYIYISSDYGVTWRSDGGSAQNWSSISVSSTGQYQSACVYNGNIYTSSNYGVNWSAPRDSVRTWNSISVSSTGQYQSAVVSVTPGNNIYTSSDYGVNWTSRDSTRTWISISVSSTGQYQSALVANGNVYVSTNYGVNWASRENPRNWCSISISSTGQYQSAVVKTAPGDNTNIIYTSSNYGANWTPRDSTRNWFSISVSSTGQYQTAVVDGGLTYISSNFGETWSSSATDSRSLGITYGKNASGVGMWVATAGRRDRDVAASAANTMAYSYDGKLWSGITATAGLSDQAWTVAYGNDGFGVGMWVAGGYDAVCGLKWSYDGITWSAALGSGAHGWASYAVARRVTSVYWNGTLWYASTSAINNGEETIGATSGTSTGYLLYSYNGKNWLPVLSNAINAFNNTNTPNAYTILPNSCILDFGSFYDDQTQRGEVIAKMNSKTIGSSYSSIPTKNVNTIIPYGRGTRATKGNVSFLLGGDSGLSAEPITSELSRSTTSLSVSTDGGVSWRAVPNSTNIMSKVNKLVCDETTGQIVAVGTGNYSLATSTITTCDASNGWTGVFGSRMTNTRPGLFDYYGTDVAWFEGAKMWIATGRTKTRNSSTLAVSVNGTVWLDAKIVTKVNASSADEGQGGGMINLTTNSVNQSSVATTRAIIPYTSATTPLITYTNSAVAFSTQVSSVAVNSQYNRAIIGGSSVQFVAGGGSGSGGSNNGGLAYSYDGLNWSAAPSSTGAIFQTPTNVITTSGTNSFDSTFGTEALTQRLFATTYTGAWWWISVALSSTGQYQTAVAGSNGLLWTSYDYGVTWTSRLDSTTRFWYSVSVSSTGQYQSACEYLYNTGGYIWTSSDYGISWTSRESARNWISISVSGTGQYQTACVQSGQIYTSSNYGINWTPRSGAGTNMPSWCVSISSSGQYQTVVQMTTPYMWISSDFGVTWLSRSEVLQQSKSISVSSTGQYQTAVPWSGFIWTSSNFGLNWTSRTTAFGNLELRGVSVSSSGQYQTVVVRSTEGGGAGGGPILRSSDFGETWTMLSQYIAIWNSVSVSSSGQYQTAVSSGPGDIWTSYDFGVTWVQRSTNTRITDFTHIKSSSSGQYQIATSGRAGNFNGQFYISSNYGQTWLPRNNLASWLGCAVSGTGATMITASASASTLTSRNTYPFFNTLAPTFNGLADYIDLGIPAWTYSTQFRSTMTIECWFKTTDMNNQKSYADLVSRWATGGPDAQFMLFMNQSGQIVWSGNNIFGILSPLSYKDTQWHHVAITYNSATGVGILYIDGVFVATATNSSFPQLDNKTNLKLVIGSDHAAVVAPVNTDRQFRGAISDVRIWDVVRSASEILDNYRYRLNGNESRLVGYWKLDPSTATGYPGTVTNFIDSTSPQDNSIGLQFDGGVTWSNTNTNTNYSLYDVTAATFDGIDDYVNLGVPSWTHGTTTQFRSTMTIECWFKTSDTNNQKPSGVLVSRNITGGTSSQSQFIIYMIPTGEIGFGLTNTDNSGQYHITTGKYKDVLWHHVAVTYNSSPGVKSIYIDGVLSRTDTLTTFGQLSNNTTVKLVIGNDDGARTHGYSDRQFRGFISDVRIWNVDRTANQIFDNYRYQLIGNETGLMGYWKLNQSTATGYPGTVTQFTDSTTPQDNSIGVSFVYNVWTYNTKLSLKPKNQLSILRSRDYGNTFDTISTRNALNFDGIDDYIELGDNITELAAGDFTIECWIKTSQVNAPIFSCINSNTSWEAGERHMYINASGRPTFVGYGNNYINPTSENTNVSDNTWHHIAIVWDYSGSGTSGTGKVYIDGQDRTGINNYFASTLGFVGTFKIGIPNNWETFSYFNGSIAEFRIWKVARSATEILKNYSIPLTGMEPGLVTYLRLDQGHPEGINTNINYAENNMPYGGYSGVLLNFALTGSFSNWVSGFNNQFKKFDYGQFSSFSMTKLGDIQTAVVNGGTIYRSTDYGNNWDISANIDVINVTYSELSSIPSLSLGWKSVAISSDANYQTGVVSGGQIYVNSNYGRETWLKVESSRTWTYVAISSDGKYQSALESTNGKIYLNSTFGKGTWTDSSHNNVNKAWSGIAMSSNGRYQAATTSGSGKLFVNSNYGLGAWSQTEATTNRNWFGVSISSSGQYQTAIVRDGLIYIDSNYGSIATWSTATQAGSRSWQAIAMSASGQYQTAVVGGGRIYVNSNYGNSDWTEITTVPDQNWISVAISSSTGQYQTAAGKDGFIYINSNYGLETWTQVNSSRNWISVAVSANGKYQTAVVDAGNIYFSRNYGATWSTTAGVDYLGNNWTDVAVSSETGLYQIACVDGGYLYRSTNTGSTWTSTTVLIDGSAQSDNRVWKAVAISANGEFGLACVNSTTTFGRLYRTIDYGATWASLSITVDGSTQTTSTNRSWVDVGMSANGKYQVACTGGTSGNIYYSKNYGVVWTLLSAAGTRAWSSISLSENSSTITATTNDSNGGIFSYTMPDDQYYSPLSLINTGSTVSSTVRAIAYGNSGTGAATDGYWLAGADASGHTLAYSYNGIDWLPVSGSKTALFNAVNGIAYGANLSGVYMWVAVGVPFIGSVYGTNAFSIAYSYDMINWTGVLNRENFTGQGNRVTYGKDENGRGMWVAVGKSDGSLFSNVGASFGYGINNTTVFYSYNGVDWCAAQGSGIFVLEGNDISWGVDASGVSTWVATGVGYTNVNNGAYITGGQIAYSTNGRVWIAANTPTTPPFTNAGLSVFYGRGGSQGAGNARWIVGGNGGNVFWYSSRPSFALTSAWTSLASNSAFAPFQICSSICYSNGIWIATNNTGNTNTIARSTNGGDAWSAVSLSSVSSYMNGCVDVAANSYCGFSLAYADFEADTNLRSWVSIEGTKNFLFDGGVTTVGTVSSNVNPSTYNTNNVWWVAGGIDASNTGVIGYTTDPSGATGWTKAITSVISQGSVINHIAFSPHTQTWLAVGKGTSPVSLYSDSTGKTWTSSSGTSYSNSLNTCIWNQLVSTASSSGRWIAGGLTTSGGSSAASLFMSTDVYGDNFTPIEGTGAILSEVYSLAFNGRVWITAGVPNPSLAPESQCCMMRTFDISGASNWVSILGTKTNGTSPNNGDGGFDTSARSITWNSQQNMWIATGENSGIPDASSSILYSLDISGSPGSWRSVRESNSLFSIQGNSVAFTGTKWIAAGEGVNTIISTSGTNASIANSWSGVPSASNLLSTRATDIAYTGTSIVATGQGSLYTGIVSSDASGTSWVGKNLGFETSPQVSSATSVFYEPSNSGGVLVATGKSASNSISYSTDYGANWTGSTNSDQLFTNGGNSVEYIGNDTLFVGGGNNVYWNGKRWISVGNIIDRSNEVVSGKLELDSMSGSTIAISDDGIMWSNVPSEFTEGRFVVSNPRIGAAPLIDSQIVISDGCDTELTSDNGSNSYSSLIASSANASANGMGLGIAQIDIISENPIIPSAASAISNGNQVDILGVGINANGTGIAETPGFDNTAFSITVRPSQ